MESVEAIFFESVLDRFTARGGLHYIDVPSEASQPFISQNVSRILCSIDDKVEFHCALMPKGDGTFIISVGTPIRAQAKLKLGQKVKVVIRKDESEYGRKMPDELKELLLIDEEGNRRFHALTPGRQRAILYYVDGAKSVQVRIDRAIKMIDRLKVGKEHT
ncbi:DUF1905 domain-containing protein [Tellurirhabdus bombi]|uniref:DUF1905 domain-containing protein n=1 Tax=Tellurirhabdus bombi TaxID=2907205 RepID=UPI001F445AE9|nr:YdeI/OmpD-associated family protein [Tellurirhabdus bombi]